MNPTIFMKIISSTSLFQEAFQGKSYRWDGRDGEGWYDQKIKDGFEQIAQSIGDTGFNRPITYCYSAPVFIDTVAAIHVYALNGSVQTQIDSLFEIDYDLPYACVISNYKNRDRIDITDDLENFNLAEKPLMSSTFRLRINLDSIENDEIHPILKIQFTNGKDFSIDYGTIDLSNR